MSTLNATDLFAVERNGVLYKLANEDMSTVNDTDLFVVERGGTNYKVEAQYVGGNTGSIATPVEVLTPINGSGLQEGVNYEPLSSAITAVDNTGGNFTATTSALVLQTQQNTYHDHADYSFTNSNLNTNFNAADARAFLAGTGTITSSFYLKLPSLFSSYRSNLSGSGLNRAEFTCTSGYTLGIVKFENGSYSTEVKAINPSGQSNVEMESTTVGFFVTSFSGTLTFQGMFKFGQSSRHFFANGSYVNGTEEVLKMTNNTGFANISVGDTLNISSGGTVDVNAIDGTASPYPTITVASGTYAVGTTFSRVYDTYDSQITFANDTNLADIIATAKQANSDGADYIQEQTNVITNVATSGSNQVLTFQNSTNFSFFSVGDTVQLGAVPVGYNKNYGTMHHPSGWLLDGNLSTRIRVSFRATLTVPIPSGTTIFYQYHQGRGNYFVYTTDGSYYNTQVGSNMSGNPVAITVSVPTGKYISSVGCGPYQGGGGNANKITVNGNTLSYNPSPQEGGPSLAQPQYTIQSIDSAASTITVNGGTWANGDRLTHTFNNATIGSIKELSGSVMKVSNVSNGPFSVGKYLKGAQITGTATAAGSVVFTSENSGTTAMTTTNATVASRVWRLETSSYSTGPWTLVSEYLDTAAVSSQDGATAWAGRPTLSANTFYRVRVTYTSDNADQQVSNYNTFKTAT